MNKELKNCCAISIVAYSAMLLGCDGSTADLSDSTSEVENQLLASIDFADSGLRDCVMASEKVMTNEVEELECDQSISDLSGLEMLTELESFSASALDMQVVDFSVIPQVKRMIIRNTVRLNNENQVLDIKNNPALEELYLDQVSFANVALSGNPNLKSLDLFRTSIESLDLSNNTKLERLYVTSSPIGNNIDLTMLKELNWLRLTGVDLTEIDLSQNNKLEFIALYSNALKQLDVSNAYPLKELLVEKNNISELTLGDHPELGIIDLSENAISEVNLTGYPELVTLTASGNPITELNISANAKLKYLTARQTELSYINVSNNPAIAELDFRYSNATCETVTQMNMEALVPDLLSYSAYGVCPDR